jgi:hypothetical protein
MCAAHVFSLSKNYGDRVPAGRNRILKVGKAGCNSNARFQSQHYNPSSAPSNLAHSLLEVKIAAHPKKQMPGYRAQQGFASLACNSR